MITSCKVFSFSVSFNVLSSNLRIYSPSPFSQLGVLSFSQKCDFLILQQTSHLTKHARVNGAYQRKIQKVQPVYSYILEGSKPDGSTTWRENSIKNKVPIIDPTSQYSHWLILKIISIAKGARITPERWQRVIIREGITPQRTDLLTEILYNRAAILAWDFTIMGKIKPEVALPQKICTVEHKTWRVPCFQSPKLIR